MVALNVHVTRHPLIMSEPTTLRPGHCGAIDLEISKTSLVFTIAMSFIGLLWSIMLYVLSTKWQCSVTHQTLWESQLKPYLKKCLLQSNDEKRRLRDNRYQTCGINSSSSHNSDEKWDKDDGASVEKGTSNNQDCEEMSSSKASKQMRLGSSRLIMILLVTQILAKILVVIVNIIYFALNYDRV